MNCICGTELVHNWHMIRVCRWCTPLHELGYVPCDEASDGSMTDGICQVKYEEFLQQMKEAP